METTHITDTQSRELAVFQVGPFVCGLDISCVQEINKNLELTVVRQAPDYVSGIVNLRGQILTIIDLRKKFGLESRERDRNTRNVVVNTQGEFIGLLVDQVDDVIALDDREILPPPPHIRARLGRFLEGVVREGENLIAVLDVEQLTALDDEIHN